MLLVDLQYIIFLGGHVKSFRFIMLALFALTFTVSSLGFAQRGSDGVAQLLYWQAPSMLNNYLSGGTKEQEGSSLILEPFARYNQDGEMVPWLVDEIPTIENGGVSEDLTSITWKISEGILWSDGTPLTSEDAVFTAAYCMAEGTGCAHSTSYADVASVDALDELTVKVTFAVAKPFPYGPFVSQTAPIIQKAQFEDCIGIEAANCTEQNFAPIGTGPFIVSDFKPNDVVVYDANENFRDASKPHFQTIILKGGGDAAAAARAVLETGEGDYAWNLQVEPEILDAMVAKGLGTVVTAFANNVERLMVNFTNDDPSLGDDRAAYLDGNNPHPFLSDISVRQALSMAIDRQVLVDIGYGAAGQPSCNVLVEPIAYRSTANDGCLVADVEGANNLLDEAGWIDSNGNGVRDKDGVELSILYQTSTNSVRQGTQAIVKQMWEAIGVEVELRNLSASVFFGGDPASPDTYGKFFADIEMYTNGFSGTDPETYMGGWVCDEISDKSNNWQGNNIPRWCNPDYDALVAEMSGTAGIEARAALAKEMNDMLVNDLVMIPLIHRGSVSAHSNTVGGVIMNAWDSELWNIADWTRQ